MGPKFFPHPLGGLLPTASVARRTGKGPRSLLSTPWLTQRSPLTQLRHQGAGRVASRLETAPADSAESLQGKSGQVAECNAKAALIFPEILEPIRCERRVANRRGNRPVAKIVLDRPGVPPIVGQLVAQEWRSTWLLIWNGKPAASPARATM